MKTALIILPACLLALAHLIGAQSSIEDCPSVKNLRSQCKKQAKTAKEITDFCTGSCFGEVLGALEDCDIDVARINEAAAQECEK